MNIGIKQTLLASVYDVAIESPLDHAPKISQRTNNNVYLKREDLQPINSFKIRGAYNKIASLSAEQKKRGVLTASAGNHAQGVALSAKKLGLSALIVMPQTTPRIKIDVVTDLGAKVKLFGDNYSEAYEHCKKLTKRSNRVFIHPFDDPLVIAGQGTVGRELLEQLPSIDYIFIPVGGGGLLAGIAQYVKQLKPSVVIIGVEPADSNAMGLSLGKNKQIELDHVGLFADGVAVKKVGNYTFKIAQLYVDEVITVNTDQICAAVKSTFEETRGIVEPAGALGLAGLEQYFAKHKIRSKNAVTICSGANMTFEKLQFIAERTLVGSNKEALFCVTLDESPGALKTFCEQVVNGYNITEFNYRLHKRDKANIFVGIYVGDDKHKKSFIRQLKKHGYEFQDMSDDELAKDHIRHMIGGPSHEAKNEILYEIIFPEKPGALGSFLNKLNKSVNISLFHYRGQGSDVGKVLIGFEATDKSQIERSFIRSGIDFTLVKSACTDVFV